MEDTKTEEQNKRSTVSNDVQQQEIGSEQRNFAFV